MGELIELRKLTTIEQTSADLASRARKAKLPVEDVLFDETEQTIRVILWHERSREDRTHIRSYYIGVDHNRGDGQYLFSVGIVDSQSSRQISVKTVEPSLRSWSEFFDSWEFTLRRIHRLCGVEDFLFDPTQPSRIAPHHP